MEQREGYKKTAVGWIPEDWDVVELTDILIEKPVYGANASAIKYDGETTYRYIRITDINDNGKIIDNGKVGISKEKNEPYVLKKNDVIIARTGNTVGKSYIHLDDNENYAFAGYLIRFRIDEQKYNVILLFHILHSAFYWNWVSSMLRIGAQPNINSKEYQTFSLPKPSLPEQKKIADILTTVDDKISSIDSRIQQTEKLKKGLMEKLLTEGIGHTEFKETEIGRIPVGWDVVKFEDVSINFDGKRVPIKSEDRQNMQGEYPYYGAQGIIDHVNDYIFDGEYLLIAEDGENVKSRKNDIAFIATGKFWVNNHAHIVKANELSVLCYLKFILNFIDTKKYITGMAQPKLNKGKLNSILIQLPPIPEQKQITTILSTLDDKLDILNQKKSQYQTLKKGLSQQLLTGQMRVKV